MKSSSKSEACPSCERKKPYLHVILPTDSASAFPRTAACLTISEMEAALWPECLAFLTLPEPYGRRTVCEADQTTQDSGWEGSTWTLPFLA